MVPDAACGWRQIPSLDLIMVPDAACGWRLIPPLDRIMVPDAAEDNVVLC